MSHHHSHRNRFLLISWLFAAMLVPAWLGVDTALASDWPQFRGPGGLGVSPDAKNLPAAWSAERNLLWKVKLPGPGSSSPIVVGDKIFVTCYSGYGLDIHHPGDLKELKRNLVCLDRSGKILWQRDVPADQPERPFLLMHAVHGYASSTPVADSEHVYVFYGKSGVLAYDFQGKKLWQASVGSDSNPWGSGSSPVLSGDLIIVNASMESNKLVALNKRDGKQVWASPGVELSWATPLSVTYANGTEEVLVSAKYKLRAYDPKTGAEVWSCPTLPDYIGTSLTAHDGVIYVIGTKERAGMAVRSPSAFSRDKGEKREPQVLWSIKRGSNVASPIYHEGHLYWCHENTGVAYCANAADGKLVYEQHMVPDGADQRLYASPVLADGKIYYVTRKQGTFVVPAAPQFKVLAHNTLEGDDSIFNATPAIAQGHILLRSNRFLYCIGNPTETGKATDRP